MENKDMKVTSLLNDKRELEMQIDRTINAIKCLKGELANSYNFNDGGTVGIYSDSQEFRISATKEVMLVAVTKMLEHYESELEPINKKLEAIELMLNS